MIHFKQLDSNVAQTRQQTSFSPSRDSERGENNGIVCVIQHSFQIDAAVNIRFCGIEYQTTHSLQLYYVIYNCISYIY